MLSFESDYIAGAHPEILKRLTETNLESLPGYGNDHYCTSAKEKIRSMYDEELCDGVTSRKAYFYHVYSPSSRLLFL